MNQFRILITVFCAAMGAMLGFFLVDVPHPHLNIPFVGKLIMFLSIMIIISVAIDAWRYDRLKREHNLDLWLIDKLQQRQADAANKERSERA